MSTAAPSPPVTVDPVAVESAAPLMTNRERLRALLGDRRNFVLALGFCSFLSGLAEAGVLALVAQIAATAVKGSSRVHTHLGPFYLYEPVRTVFLIALGLVLVRILLQVPLSILPARIAAGVQARLRRQLFDAYTRASWEVKSADREGHLQETMTSQVLQATGGALQTTALVIAGFTFIVLMASAITLNALAAVVVLAAATLLFALLRPLNVLGAKLAKRLSRAQLAYAGGVNEANRVAEETQVFGVGAEQRARVYGLVDDAEGLFFRTQLIGRLSPSLYQSAIYLILVGGLWILWGTGRTHFASLGAVVLIIVRAGTYGQVVQGSYQGLRQSLPFIERLQDAARRYGDSEHVDGTVPLERVRTISTQELSFGYRPGRPVLKDLSFQVAAGESIGVVGPSGAGKSTLIGILLQLRVPDEGSYLINGVPVGEFVRADWYRQIAYVPQQPRLLHATVAENIRFLRDIEMESVERAARLASIHDEIMSWPLGYETVVGPRADAVSGGQQQRICLARALAARPAVLVLDEPTSALDPHSETLIQRSLSALRHELTLFVIAHRMSTLDICDRVMVIEHGRLAAFDKIDRLERENPYFRSASMIAAGASLP
jgi:ATP-binding cassette subfamily B protein